jgi:hypothetical protein
LVRAELLIAEKLTSKRGGLKMLTKKMYRYLGRNGFITSAVLLEDIPPIPMIEL